MKHLFDDKAGSYDSWYQTAAGRFVDRVEKEAVLAYLEPRPGMSVLDIGVAARATIPWNWPGGD
ncbi:hypothetical protein [Desulfofundulus thermocisternus]|uniref:hypothetical protein n=1 Tax=Desulfofundulus thermocisternus TaxID=42471 RepID=UPI00217D0221|nr:hypothetical protein [Desulfofundulus thermocisternus]MCS5694542.1 hypothetical protein [Desulfofundulus thermocisternus]